MQILAAWKDNFYNGGMNSVCVNIGGQQVQVRNIRIAKMILWLLGKESSIKDMPKGHVTFHFSGRDAVMAELLCKEDIST